MYENRIQHADAIALQGDRSKQSNESIRTTYNRAEGEPALVSVYDSVADLPLTVEDYELELRERETSSDFTRTSTVIALRGAGETGYGEDVTYNNDDHHTLVEDTDGFPLAGEYTLEEYSEMVGDLDLFPDSNPNQAAFRYYRRWGFESAALDLALKQADKSLAEALDREYDPVRFVMSTRLGDPPSFDLIETWLENDPELEFKLDPTSDWTPELIEQLAETNAVTTVDLKGQYEGTVVDQPADPELYERVVEGFPDVLIEDPELTDETRPILEGETERVTWDYPIHGVESVEDLRWEPEWLNIKPSRFGSVRSLFETIEYCEEHDIQMFGGGQFELDVGREHIHAIASLFYPDGPNDIAPSEYNDPEPREGLPASPLAPPRDPRGLRWQSDG